VGGTVGDIEGLPFLEALRQMRSDVGPRNCFYVHVTFLPHIAASRELKTKPTQHSVRELRGIGIHPNAIIARADHDIPKEHIEKIALFCDVEERAVIPAVTSDILYSIPLQLEQAGLGSYIVESLGLPDQEPDLGEWQRMIEEIERPKPSVRIGIVGKYVELHDAYMSVRESLYHAGIAHHRQVEVVWIHSGELEKDRGWEHFDDLDGIVVPGGFGYRGIEGKIAAARWARENKVPYLGLCLGMQVMCIELARAVLGNEEPNSTEFDAKTPYPVISLMPDQHGLADMGGTMRLGIYPCQLQPGTRAAAAYKTDRVSERHRHRWEFNNAYRDLLAGGGMLFSGLSPDGRLVEISELADHPFMLGCQFHPEFKSRPNRPHPLFSAFLKAAIDFRRANRAEEVSAAAPDGNGQHPPVDLEAREER
ncbi:MAG: CTP synthase, partial [Chloroflexota bacterium]